MSSATVAAARDMLLPAGKTIVDSNHLTTNQRLEAFIGVNRRQYRTNGGSPSLYWLGNSIGHGAGVTLGYLTVEVTQRGGGGGGDAVTRDELRAEFTHSSNRRKHPPSVQSL